MMGGMKKTSFSIALAACSFQLPKLEDGSLWIQLTPAGAFRAADGRPEDAPNWHLDAPSAAVVIARFKQRQTPPVIDYEHQTLRKEQNGQPAPAAGRLLDLEWREGSGLWGRAEFTDRARQMIEVGEYLYFSPVFAYAPDGTVLAVLMGALTNDPAIDGMEPLARRAAASLGFDLNNEDNSVNKLLKAVVAALDLKAEATQEEAIAALTALKPALDAQQKTLADLRTALVLPAEASGEQIAAATAQLKTAHAPDPARFVPIAAVSELQGQIVALSTRLNQGELEGLIGGALKDGRLLPAMESWARELGAKDLGQLKGYLDKAAPIAALNRMQGQQPPTGDTHNLSSAELEAAKLTGLSPAEYAKAKGV